MVTLLKRFEGEVNICKSTTLFAFGLEKYMFCFQTDKKAAVENHYVPANLSDLDSIDREWYIFVITK